MTRWLQYTNSYSRRMSHLEFLLDYGLFLAKIVTVVVALV
ncbi:protease SohB, partial [Aeromonas jandaei]